MFLFRRKKPALLGIDITSAAVKLLELSKSGGRLKVEAYGVTALPHEAIVDKNIANIEAIADAIKAAVKQSGTKLKHAAVAVAGSSVITKTLILPASLSEQELEDQIELEADQYIPYALDEVSMDFEVLGINQDNPEMMDVLLAASRKENVDDRVAALEIAGLKAEIVDVESYATENCFDLIIDQLPEVSSDMTVAIADVGSTLTTLNVLHDNKIVYTREQGFGGKQLTEEIQRRYGLSYEEAGLAKKHGGLPDNYMLDVLEPFKRSMVKQVGRSLQFFISSNAYRPIDAVILAGGCASIPGIERLVEEELQLVTVVANPFINMALSPKIKPQSLSNDAAAMIISCGLAMRSFD